MSEVDSVLILARGLGTRMRQELGESGGRLPKGGPASSRLSDQASRMAAAGLKGLLPIAGRPFLDYLFAAIVTAGFRRVGLVVGPESRELRRYGAEIADRAGVTVEFPVQVEPRGTADAVAAGEAFAAGGGFVMLNSDNLMSAEALRALRTSSATDVVPTGFVIGFDRDALLGGNIPEARVSRCAVLQAHPDGRMIRVVEKPDRPDDYAVNGRLLVSMNCWRFPPAIFQACRAIGPSPRGEYEITDAVQWLVDTSRAEFHILTRAEPVYDLTGREDIAPLERALSGVSVPFPPPAL